MYQYENLRKKKMCQDLKITLDLMRCQVALNHKVEESL